MESYKPALVKGITLKVENAKDWCKRYWDTFGFDYDLSSITDDSAFIWPLEGSDEELLEVLHDNGYNARLSSKYI